MHYYTVLLFFGLTLHSPSFALPYQGDAQLGKLKVPSCGFCHGNNGIAVKDNYPNLAGQKQPYLLQTMKDYQNKKRVGPMAEMMTKQLSRLNNKDLADIAAFYATMENEKSVDD